tara:strand:+ start:192 stop:515 length:324 start_codon:yes stop_codon:yes gene_type:complete
MARAKGKYAQAISDRSGVAFPYKQMVKEWNGSFVHKSEFENKHPQLQPGPVKADAQALENARPQEQSVLFAKIGQNADAIFSSSGMQPATQINDLTMNFKIGTVTVS